MQEIGQNVDLQWDGLHQWIQQKHEVLKIEFWLSHNKELSALWISFVLVHEQVTDAQIKAILESMDTATHTTVTVLIAYFDYQQIKRTQNFDDEDDDDDEDF